VSTITFIVPTVGRPSLSKTLASIECRLGDEILLVCNESTREHLENAPFVTKNPYIHFVQCAQGKDWGHTERNVATPFAKCDYLAHIDDDDWYAAGTRDLMADAIAQTPGRPVLFRMQFPNGITLWQDRKVRCGNVGTPMILTPNEPEKLGQFRSFVGGDCQYLLEMKWAPSEIVWREEIIALLGHNIGD
jgi:hypothetical protein